MNPVFFFLADNLGTILIIVSLFFLIYGICTLLVSDETLYDQELLPTTDPRKLTYYIEPQPPEGPTLFPTVFEDPEVYVSFVVPAYNEQKRIPAMLDETIAYLKQRREEDTSFTYEIIVVDDGCKDKTDEVVLRYAAENPEIRLLKQPYNMGKGAAIQVGCIHARGKLILMVDADGATKITEFALLEQKILKLMETNKQAIVVGSRAHLEGESKAKRDIIRDFLGKGFHFLVWLAGVRGINDTQCGFKLFSREASQWIFPNQHIRRWCFDPELLVIGRNHGMHIAEVPVEWQEIEGSKMKVTAMIRMAFDLLRIAAFHRIGLWTVRMKSDIRTEASEE